MTAHVYSIPASRNRFAVSERMGRRASLARRKRRRSLSALTPQHESRFTRMACALRIPTVIMSVHGGIRTVSVSMHCSYEGNLRSLSLSLFPFWSGSSRSSCNTRIGGRCSPFSPLCCRSDSYMVFDDCRSFEGERARRVTRSEISVGNTVSCDFKSCDDVSLAS